MKPNKYVTALMESLDKIMKGHKPAQPSEENLLQLTTDAASALAKFFYMRSQLMGLKDENLNGALSETEYFIETICKKAQSIEQDQFFHSIIAKFEEAAGIKEEKVIN